MAQDLQRSLRRRSPKFLGFYEYVFQDQTFILFSGNYIFFSVHVIKLEAEKRGELEDFLAGKSVGMLRITKFRKRDKLIKDNERGFKNGTVSLANFILRSTSLFDVDVSLIKSSLIDDSITISCFFPIFQIAFLQLKKETQEQRH